MKNTAILLSAWAGFLSYNNSGGESKSNAYENLYFKFTIDRKKDVSLPPEKITTSYNVALKKPVFKIFVGEYGKINVKVFGGDATNNPKVSDHVIMGKFRVKHEFGDVKI